MNLTIGSTSFEITKYKKLRDKLQGTYMKIWIPEESITVDDLRALLKDNALDIIITDDAGNQTIFSGYSGFGSLTITGGEYIVEQFCDSELAHLLNEARAQIAEQQAVINTQTVALQNHAQVITEQAEKITEQTKTIEAQTEQMAALELNNKELNETVNALLGLEEE